MAGIGLNRLAVPQEVDGGPVGIVIQRPPLGQRLMFGILNVGDELGALSSNTGLQFRRRMVSVAGSRSASHGNKVRGWNSRSTSSGK